MLGVPHYYTGMRLERRPIAAENSVSGLLRTPGRLGISIRGLGSYRVVPMPEVGPGLLCVGTYPILTGDIVFAHRGGVCVKTDRGRVPPTILGRTGPLCDR